jgi:hypothetical protein
MLTRLETFQPQGGESFYSTAVTFVKVLKQWGLGLTQILTGKKFLLVLFFSFYCQHINKIAASLHFPSNRNLVQV